VLVFIWRFQGHADAQYEHEIDRDESQSIAVKFTGKTSVAVRDWNALRDAPIRNRIQESGMSDSRLLNVIDYIESRNRILTASRGLPAQTVRIFLCFLNLVLDKSRTGCETTTAAM